MTCVSSDVLLEEVRQDLEAEGCFAEIEIVRLFGAAPGQRNWEINTIWSEHSNARGEALHH